MHMNGAHCRPAQVLRIKKSENTQKSRIYSEDGSPCTARPVQPPALSELREWLTIDCTYLIGQYLGATTVAAVNFPKEVPLPFQYQLGSNIEHVIKHGYDIHCAECGHENAVCRHS